MSIFDLIITKNIVYYGTNEKTKLKYFNVVKSEAEKQINEFLSQNDSIDVKSISMDDTGVMPLFEE